MNFSAWSIKNPIPAIMLFVILSIVGLYAFQMMKVQNFPDTDLPIITVTTTLVGAAPNQLESEVARKIENSLATIQGVKHINSRISDGLVTNVIEFRIEKPIQEALDDVRSAVTRVRGNLPSNVLEPIINKLDLASTPVLAFAVKSNHRDAQELSWFVDNELARSLLSVRGVGAINRVGGVEREIAILLDPAKLNAVNTTVAEISRQLALINIEKAGGKARIGESEQPLRTLAAGSTVADIAALSINLADGRKINLSQVATISDSFAKPQAAAYLNGEEVIGFEVVRSKGASEIEIKKAILPRLQELEEQNPGLKFVMSFDFVEQIESEFSSSMVLLYEGAILAVLVVWLFLRDLRATIVSAVALPLSVLPAFIGMWYMGFTINIVTLLALSLVVGILVDDAIVEVENIVRHMRMGKSPMQAALEAADEIGLAVIATTFTLIAVFLPTAYMSGVVGKIFKNFGWTAVFAIFSSLVVARLLTPMMSAYILRPIIQHNESNNFSLINSTNSNHWRNKLKKLFIPSEQEAKWIAPYLRLVEKCIDHRWLVIALAIIFFIVSIYLIRFIPSGFIPPDDNSQTQIYLEAAPGTTLKQMQKIAEDTRKLVIKLPDIQSVYTTIGAGAAGSDGFSISSNEERKATLTILLKDRGMRPKKQLIEQHIRHLLIEIPGVRSKVGLGGSGEKFQFALIGNDPTSLVKFAKQLEKEIRTIAGVGNIESTAALQRNEIAVIPNLQRSAELGVTPSAIADTLRVATIGDYESQLAKLNLPQRQIPIVVRLSDTGIADLDQLSRLSVPGTKGPVSIAQVATLQFSSGPSVLTRFDRSRNISFTIELADIPLGEMQKQLDNLPAIKNLPKGISLVPIGDVEAQAEMMSGFAIAMGLGVLCIYIVLVILFHAFWHPLTIMAALPLSFGGAFIALLLTNKMLAMPSLIGLLMLIGVSTKNSILLVDYTIEAVRKNNLSVKAGLLDACSKRARPIIMTSIAMGAGMLPIALGLGSSDTSFRAPMAIAVIGGLITSTILSLLVVPAVYLVIDSFANRMKRLVFNQTVN